MPLNEANVASNWEFRTTVMLALLVVVNLKSIESPLMVRFS